MRGKIISYLTVITLAAAALFHGAGNLFAQAPSDAHQPYAVSTTGDTGPRRLQHGGTPPHYNNPSILGVCYDGTSQFLGFIGAELLHFPPTDYYNEPGEWVPYVVLNSVSAQATNPCTGLPQAGYTGAGEIGTNYIFTLRSNPQTALPDGTEGFILWAYDYQDPDLLYTPQGWTAIKPATIYDTLEFTTGEQFYVPDPGADFEVETFLGVELPVVNGERGITARELAAELGVLEEEAGALLDGADSLIWVGWRHVGSWPDDENLLGLSVLYQGFMQNSADPLPVTERLSGTWILSWSNEGL